MVAKIANRISALVVGHRVKAVRRILLFVILIVGSASSLAAQPRESTNEIKALVSKLSWDSVGGECNGIWRIYPDGPVAEKLVQIGQPATDELLRVLEDDNKGVAAHLILSAIWESDIIVYGSYFEGAKFIHIYNGLEWADVFDTSRQAIRYEVMEFSLMVNAETWRAKVAKYRRNASR
ncbi:MAG TPA: hypothetical protein VJM12_17980 [Pyrinomonadaceae bacterium]|nr:hypothetical protein [Pyrinomonadaceae bacterium]